MSNLQAITLSNILQKLPINNSTTDVLDAFVLQYLRDRPSVGDKYLEDKILYHVFFREEDPYEHHTRCPEISLVKTFATKAAAVDYIKFDGKDIVDSEYDNRRRPIVLCIIPNNNIDDYDPYTSPTNIYDITSKEYLTYSFDEKGYEMCMEEHKRAFNYDNTGIIPYWILHYIDDEIIHGCKLEHILDIHKTMSYRQDDTNRKQRDIDEYHTFQSDPEDYILKHN